MTPDPNRIALGIRQPWIELILRGAKTVEVRSQHTRQRGTIYLYASKKLAVGAAARGAMQQHGLLAEALPCGLLVGTVDIVDSRPCRPRDARAACLPGELLAGCFAWHLRNPRRLERPLRVKFLPYGVWFYPFRRRKGARG